MANHAMELQCVPESLWLGGGGGVPEGRAASAGFNNGGKTNIGIPLVVRDLALRGLGLKRPITSRGRFWCPVECVWLSHKAAITEVSVHA